MTWDEVKRLKEISKALSVAYPTGDPVVLAQLIEAVRILCDSAIQDAYDREEG